MPKPSRRHLLTAAASLAVAPKLVRRAVAQTSGPIKIGLIGPMSGPLAAFGRDYKLGMDIAAEQVNAAGGVGGRPLQVVIRDDKGSPTEAVAGARELVEGGCNMLLGGGFTSTALGPMTVMPELNAVFLIIGGSADSITHENFNRNSFRIVDSNYIRMSAMTEIAARHSADIDTWGAVFVEGEGPRNAWDQFRTLSKSVFPKAGLREPKFVDAVTYKGGTSDFKAQIVALMSSPARGIFTNVPGVDGVSLFVQGRTYGLGRKMNAIIDLGQEFVLAKALGSNMPDNFWSASHWYYGAYAENPMGKHLYAECVKRTNDPYPSGYVGVTYGGVQAFAQAVAHAGRADTPSVISALESITVQTAKGSLKFRPEDHQEVGDVNVLRFNASADAPGFKVSEFAKLNGSDLIEKSAPGQVLKI